MIIWQRGEISDREGSMAEPPAICPKRLLATVVLLSAVVKPQSLKNYGSFFQKPSAGFDLIRRLNPKSCDDLIVASAFPVGRTSRAESLEVSQELYNQLMLRKLCRLQKSREFPDSLGTLRQIVCSCFQFLFVQRVYKELRQVTNLLVQLSLGICHWHANRFQEVLIPGEGSRNSGHPCALSHSIMRSEYSWRNLRSGAFGSTG